MTKHAFAAFISFTIILATAGTAQAESCYDLWYKRNAIFDANGYCFKSKLGWQTFDNSDCWTSNPKLSAYEQNQVARIQRKERRKGCKVN